MLIDLTVNIGVKSSCQGPKLQAKGIKPMLRPSPRINLFSSADYTVLNYYPDGPTAYPC